MFFNTGIPY